MAGVKEVVAKVRAEFGTTTGQAEDITKFVLATIQELAVEEAVVIKGFGTFSYKESAARTCRNPQTGGQIAVPAKTKLALKTKAVEK